MSLAVGKQIEASVAADCQTEISVAVGGFPSYVPLLKRLAACEVSLFSL